MTKDEGGAGAVPSSGVVIKGLRLLITCESRNLTVRNGVTAVLGSIFLFGAGTDPQRCWLTVSDADTGEKLAVRRFSTSREARSARERFVGSVSATPDADLTQAHWKAVFDAV